MYLIATFYLTASPNWPGCYILLVAAQPKGALQDSNIILVLPLIVLVDWMVLDHEDSILSALLTEFSSYTSHNESLNDLQKHPSK